MVIVAKTLVAEKERLILIQEFLHVMHLIVNSEDRVSGTSADFRISLRSAYHAGKIRLVAAQMPNHIYTIRSGINDTIYFNDGSARTASLTPGFYTIDTLLVECKTQLDASPSSLVFALSKSNTTGKITISAGSAFTLDFSQSNTPWRQLGFAATQTSSAPSHTGANVYDLTPPRFLYVRVLEWGTTYLTTSEDGHVGTFVLPLDVNSLDRFTYTEGRGFMQEVCLSGRGIQSFRVQLLHEDGSFVSLEGTEWSFVVALE